jgi:hypothetical protein
MILFIASGYLRNGKGAMVESATHETREAAAAQLLGAHPSLRSCHTSYEFEGRSTGSNMQFHDRPYGQAGKHTVRIG